MKLIPAEETDNNQIAILDPLMPGRLPERSLEAAEKILSFATEGSCGSCGTGRCGEGGWAFVEMRENMALIGGICKSCAVQFSGLDRNQIVKKILEMTVLNSKH